MSKAIALVAGGGGAAGVAVCRKLRDSGYRVFCAGRNRSALETEVGDGADELVEVELASTESVQNSIGKIGNVDLLVYNAGRIDLLPIAETTPEVFLASWQVNTLGAFLCARAVAPSMVAQGRGSMIFMGATASLRGGARTHAFASAKHALRGLAASLAKELGPKGVHVAHLVIDGKIWGERTRQRFPDAQQAQCLMPEAVAQAVSALIEQPSSAWTFEMDLRPHTERWS